MGVPSASTWKYMRPSAGSTHFAVRKFRALSAHLSQSGFFSMLLYMVSSIQAMRPWAHTDLSVSTRVPSASKQW